MNGKCKVVSVLLLCLFGLAGCMIIDGDWRRKEQFTRKVDLAEPMDGGSILKVNTTNGSVTAQGTEMDTCTVVATITGRARTIERAQELAEQTQVKLQPDQDGLIAFIHYPQRKKWERIAISFDITMPNESSLVATTTNGNITVDSLNGNVKAQTTNGNVKMDQILADHIRAHTTNGNITLNSVRGLLDTTTINGSVQITLAPQANPAANIHVNATNGSITVNLPESCSVKVDAGTVNGGVKTSHQVTVSGDISKTSIKGTIGAGDGNLSLRTVNGSININ